MHKMRERKGFAQTESLIFGQDALVSLGIYLVFLIIRTIFFLYIPQMDASFLFVFCIILISWFSHGYFWGVFYTFVGTVISNYLFYEPLFGFNFKASSHFLFFSGVVMVSTLVCCMTVRLKRLMNELRESERKKDCLYQFSQKLLMCDDISKLVEISLEYFQKYTEKTVAFYYLENGVYKSAVRCINPEDEDLFFEETEQQAIQACIAGKCVTGWKTEIYSQAKGVYMPIVFENGIVAAMGILFLEKKKDMEAKLTPLLSMTIQISLVYEKRYMCIQQQEAQMETEKEKIRSNLLRAISHDLRTPLTGILGSSNILIENVADIKFERRHQLLEGIQKDARWLLHMVENLLTVTRISEEGGCLKKEIEMLEEIAGEAVSRVQKYYPDTEIEVVVPEQLLLVPMDATLIEQVIINLIENAIKHSGSKVKVVLSVTQKEGRVYFEVCDNGRGFQEDEIPLLFKTQLNTKKKNMDSTRGMGIGLSICMSIIKAHEGEIFARNRDEGGACVGFFLPLKSSHE